MAERFFVTKIRRASLTFSPFTAEQMRGFGEIFVESAILRIRSATTAADSPAPPLVPKYAQRKLTRNRQPIRDWMFRSATLAALQVKSASEDRATCGFTTQQAVQIVAAQQRRAIQWGASPKDMAKVYAAVREQLLGQVMWQSRRMNRKLDALVA
jgi:hypothetical protein